MNVLNPVEGNISQQWTTHSALRRSLVREFYIGSGFEASKDAELEFPRGNETIHNCRVINPVEAFFDIKLDDSFIDAIAR